MQRTRSLILFLATTYVVNLSFGIYYFYDQAPKENSYISSIWVTGKNYVIPEGHEYLFGDSDAYNKFAYTLLEKGGFYNPINQISAWVTPGYPLFLSAIYLIFGYAYLPVLIIQNFLLTLIYLFVFKTTFLISESIKATRIASLLTFVNIRITTYTQDVYTEILFLFILIVVLYLTIKCVSKKDEVRWFHYFWLGLLSGFAILIRPVIIPFILTIFIFFTLNRIKFKYVLTSVIIMIFLVSIWLIRNYAHFDRILLSTNSEITMGAPYLDLRKFNFWNNYDLHDFTEFHQKRSNDTLELNQEMLKKNIHISPEIREKINQGYIYEQVSYIFTKDNKDWVLAHPDLYFIRTIYLLKTILSPYTLDFSSRNRIISTIIWNITILPAFLYIFIKKKNHFFYFLIISSFSLVLLPAMTLIDSNLRYQLPFQLITTIISALFWEKLFNRIKK